MDNSPANRKDLSLRCPLCGAGRLAYLSSSTASCTDCGRTLGGSLLRTLVGISALPNARGSHACDCGHPEMRRLPDGVYHCPACAAEVIPFAANPRHKEKPAPQ